MTTTTSCCALLSLALACAAHAAPVGDYRARIVAFTQTAARVDIAEVTVPYDFETDPSGAFSAPLSDLGAIPAVSLGHAEVRYSAPSQGVRRLQFAWSSASPDTPLIPVDTLVGGEELVSMAFEFSGFDEPLFDEFGQHGGILLNAEGAVAYQSDDFGFFLFVEPNGLGGYNNLTIPDGQGGALNIAPARWASYSGFVEYTIPEPASFALLAALALGAVRRP